MRARFLLVALLIAAAARPADAHPLTEVRYDRTAAVRLAPDAIEVRYTVELNALSLHLDAGKRLTPAEIAALDRTEMGYYRAYARKVAAELAEKFSVTVDGRLLPLQTTSIDVETAEHVLIRCVLRAPWPPGGRDRSAAISDGAFKDHPGILNLTIDGKGVTGQPVEIVESDEPPLKVRTKPQALLSDEEAALARVARAEIRLPAAIAAPASPEAALGSPTVPEPSVVAAPAPDLASDLAQRGLPALFSSPLGIGVLLLAAFLFGAAHAFTPGHGKTLVAAYLIGERGTVRHAILLGIVTTLTHTGSVIAVAAVLWGVYGNDIPGRTQGILQVVAGILVIGVGVWLLFRRATGQSDHFHIHLFGGHHHHHHGPSKHSHTHAHSHSHDHEHAHGHDHSHDHGHAHEHEHANAHDHAVAHAHDHEHSHDHEHGHSHSHAHGHHHHHGPSPAKARSTASWMRIVLMGMGGGIVPCWDAVLLLVAAAAMNRVGFAIPLLLAFSLGLGAVLVGLGIGVVYAYRAGGRRFRDQRWFRFLPTVSAAFLVAVGIWLCVSAW